MIRKAVIKEEYSNNNCGIYFRIVFNWPEYGIFSFEEHICRKSFDGRVCLISCKVIRSRGNLTILYLVIYLFIYFKHRNFYSMFYKIYLQFIHVISIF